MTIKRFAAGPSLVTPGSGSSGSSGGGAARRPSGGGGGAARRGGGTGDRSEKQTDTVRTMQGIMAKLRDELQIESKAEAALKKISKDGKAPAGLESAQKISETARAFGSTSAGGTTGTQDGIWGPNTKKALQAIKDFVKQAGISGVIINPGEGASPYREMKDEDVIKTAQANITNLARLFVEVGLDAPPEAAQQGGSGYILDQVADSLHDLMIGQNPWPQYWGSRPVTVGDLRDLLTFFYLIQGLKYTDCQPLEEKKKPEPKGRGGRARGASVEESELEKFAQEVLSGSLFSFAEPAAAADEEAVPGAPAATPKEEAEGEAEGEEEKKEETPAPRTGGEGPMKGGGDGHCFSTIGHFIWWFSQRARAVYAQMMSMKREARPHPVYTDRAVTDTDVKAAQAYMAAMRNIAMQWAQIMGRVEDILRERGWTGRDGNPNPVVTLQVLLEAMQSGGGGAGRGRGGAGGRGSGGYTIPGDDLQDRALKGPIRNYMPLENLLNSDYFAAQSQAELASMTRGGLPNIDIRTWRTGSWTDIATRYIDAPTQTEQLRLFPQWAGLVRKVIQEMFTNWQRDYEGQYDVATVLRRQDRMLSTWEQYIRAKISQAQRYMDREVSRVGERKSEERGGGAGRGRVYPMTPAPRQPAQPQYADSRAGRQAERKDERARGIDQRTRARQRLEEARARQRAQRRS